MQINNGQNNGIAQENDIMSKRFLGHTQTMRVHQINSLDHQTCDPILINGNITHHTAIHALKHSISNPSNSALEKLN